MPTDWHTRDKALSSETTACKNLDPLINRSHTDSFFSPTTTDNLFRDSLCQIVSLVKKDYNGQPPSDQVCLSR